MDETPAVRCPAISDPESGLAAPADFDGLLRRLASPEPVVAVEEFARGLVRPDGRVDLCKQGVGPEQATRLVRTAVASPHATHLLLGTNGLGTPGVQAVADALVPGHGLSTVYLGCNRIDAEGAAALADRLRTDRDVRALWLKRNPIGDAGVARLAAALAGNTTLRTLDLVNTGLTAAGLEHLADALAARPPVMQRLFLGANGLRAAAVPVLLRLVRDGGVRELYLAVNHLGDDGAAALAEGLAGLGMTLGLGGNGITDVAPLAANLRDWVALDLARPPSERALGGRPNEVGDTGAALLAAALPGSTLRRLDLRFTGVTGRGARVLLAAAGQLEHLGLNGGVPRRMRRQSPRSVTPPHTDLGAIASVYR
ncbi:leucine-rich repeat domain-containing protein [Actinoplanes awajinensis]|uniref:Gala protein n=1 Tax=Actinoplanes awajinensis subsp. mycoplanecinus TaxID=135947 RepID=A0A101JCE9_9ACTN|nr:gala protein [Actinoplanes awajinensis]KUL24203.1 gala protein [Actinoplanes awajinensis subsp. mycoplanecinus]